MQDSDKSDFRAMLDLVFDTIGKPRLEPRVVRVYYDSLKQYELEDIAEALNKHMVDTERGQWTPKPADIARQIAGGVEANSQLAWSKVDRAVRTVGPYRSVCFDDPKIHRVIADMGGWISLCGTDEKEYPFKRQEFEKRYRGYAQREFDYPARLIGSAQASNERLGYHDQNDLVFIGEPGVARVVYETGQDKPAVAITHAGHLATNLLEAGG